MSIDLLIQIDVISVEKLKLQIRMQDIKIPPNNLCIDHDHGTSRFRGFLCVQCNRNLGWYDKYKDAIEKHYNFGNAPKFLHKNEGH